MVLEKMRPRIFVRTIGTRMLVLLQTLRLSLSHQHFKIVISLTVLCYCMHIVVVFILLKFTEFVLYTRCLIWEYTLASDDIEPVVVWHLQA